jgi:[ribosomal protein S5]-alanine N-acetyltransferase
MTYGKWPVVLTSDEVTLRPLRLRDRRKWDEVRAVNRDWLAPWEATRPTLPGASGDPGLPSFFQMVASHNREGRAQRSLSMAIWYQGNLVGQITLGGIVMGALRGAHIGYWIDKRFANRGITTRAVVMMTEYGFHELVLHRIEISFRPENGASRRVAEKAGYHFEAERPRFLHIDGQWRDHLVFVRENPKII